MKLEPIVGRARAGESSKAIVACNDWLRIGPGRSLSGLLDFYASHYEGARKNAKTHQNAPIATAKTLAEQLPGTALGAPVLPLLPPTLSLDTLKKWSTDYEWARRAASYDLAREDEKNALLRAHRADAFGVTAYRIEALKGVAVLLREQIFERSVADDLKTLITGSKSREYHNLWCAEEKMVGSGESAEWTTVYRFNPAILDHFRGCLKEIAQELGERHYSTEADKVLRDVAAKLDRTTFSQAQVERIASGEHPIVVLLEPYFIKPDGE